MQPTVAVIGAGAMGALYAWHFHHTGHRVVLVAAEERAERLGQGLVINGEPITLPVSTPNDPVAPVDLAIFAVKDRHLHRAIDDARHVIDRHTTIISVMNGLDSETVLAEAFEPEQVLLCVAAGMDAMREGARVWWTHPGRLLIGTRDGAITSRLTDLASWLDAAGLGQVVRQDMVHQIWWKFMVNTGINQASAAMRLPYGPFMQDGPARELMLALMHEVIAVSVAEGVNLGQADLDLWLAVLATMAPDGRTSMRQDVDAGRPTEVESFAGRMVEMGRRHGIPTPYNQAMHWMLTAITDDARTETEAK